MSEPPTVEIDGLGFAYTRGDWVFRDLSARLTDGKVLAILGPNGSGKTTLLRLLLGTLKPTRGRLFVYGACAFVPQLFEIAFEFTTLDMVLMGRARRIGVFAAPKAPDREAALHALESVGLADKAGAAFHSLSGGQRQLALIARAIVADAQVLILDEPTSALDLKNQDLVLRWIRRLARERGLTVIFTTHQPSHALAVADSTLLLFSGSPALSGPSSELLTESSLRHLYGVDLARVRIEVAGRAVESFAPIHIPTSD